MRISSWLKNWKTNQRSRSKSPTKLVAAEQMEPRTLLSASALIVGGELNVSLHTNDNVQVSSFNGNLLVQTSSGSGQLTPVTSLGTVSASSITSIVITGGDQDNTIDLGGVLAANFTSLASIRVNAGNGNDTITGSANLPDSLSGGDGSDVINSQGGNDTVDGGDGQDTINAGSGDDSILAGDGSDVVDGGFGNDTISGGNGADTITAGVGNDSVSGNNGEDSITGDAGNDFLNGDGGADFVSGGVGNDSILGGELNDVLQGDDGNDTIDGQAGNDSVNGDAGDDSLLGGLGHDHIQGGDGNDFANGGNGNDTIEGGNGSDRMLGGANNDLIFDDFAVGANSFSGADTLLGQGGNDTLFGIGGPDSLEGGIGDDLLDTRISGFVIEDLNFNEGDVTNVVNFTVRLAIPLSFQVSVDFATFSDGTNAGGTATAGVDYVATSGTLVFLPGETVKTIPVTILGDTVIEADETFFVNLSNAVNSQLSDPQGEGRIINDDVTPPPPILDVVILLDDTGSFASVGPSLANIFFSNVIPQLQAQFPGGDFAFGVAKFEDYGSGGGIDRPFILNQPVITDDTVNFNAAMLAALNRNSPGGGSSFPESDIEALYQIATGEGFDGNLDGDTVDSGPAGLASTQTNPGTGGDVPNYSTFTPDTANGGVAPTVPVPATPVDGIGFRPGARHIVLLATDAAFTLINETATVYTGVGGVTVPANQITQGGGLGDAPTNGHGVQETINALIADGIQVVGLGNEFGFPDNTPRPQLQGISTLTGALNAKTTPIENFITPGPSADDIQPGEPLYFLIDPSDPVGLANAIVLGITGAVGTLPPPPPPPPAPPPALPGPQADTLIGGDGNDTCLSADFDDSINGGIGNDFVDAGGGNDSVLGGGGLDTLLSGAGDDTINGQGGNDEISGGVGNDTYVWEGATSGNDVLNDTLGDNRLNVVGNGASNTFDISQDAHQQLTITELGKSVTVGATFNSVVVHSGNGDDTVNVGTLNRVQALSLEIHGDDGDDVLTGSGAIGAVRLSYDGGLGNDSIQGGLGNETILGGAGNDLLNGGGGNDTVSGGDDDDNVQGGDGNDVVNGDAGADFIRGNNGNDVGSGGEGNDTLNGDLGNDTLSGNDGFDSLLGAAGNDSLLGGLGGDILDGGDGNDTLDGGFNDDSILGGLGDDRIRGDHGNDTIDAGEGNDLVSGGDGNDVIAGGLGADSLNGADGNDAINGGSGNDIIVGGDGNDTLLGGSGNDIVLGEDGNDLVNGQAGTDLVAGNQGADVIIDPVAEINEAFVLPTSLRNLLDAI